MPIEAMVESMYEHYREAGHATYPWERLDSQEKKMYVTAYLNWVNEEKMCHFTEFLKGN